MLATLSGQSRCPAPTWISRVSSGYTLVPVEISQSIQCSGVERVAVDVIEKSLVMD